MPFNLDFSILACFFFYFLIIDLYFLISAVIAHPFAELVIPKGIPSKEAIAEIKIHPVIAEAKIRKCST